MTTKDKEQYKVQIKITNNRYTKKYLNKTSTRRQQNMRMDNLILVEKSLDLKFIFDFVIIDVSMLFYVVLGNIVNVIVIVLGNSCLMQAKEIQERTIAGDNGRGFQS